jgi:hypothetical protein
MYSGGTLVRLKNTRVEAQSILYDFSDAYFYSTLLNTKKYPVVHIQQREFFKHFKNQKTVTHEPAKQVKKRTTSKNSISSSGCNG